MKICMSEKSIKDFSSFFKNAAIELQKKNNYTNIDDMIRALYNKALSVSNDTASQDNKDVVIQHLVMIPLVLNDLFPALNQGINNLIPTTMKALKNQDALEALIKNYADLVGKANLFDQVDLEEVVEEKEVEVDYDAVKPLGAVHRSLDSSLGSETEGLTNVLDESKQGAFNAIRTMMDSYDESDPQYKVKAVTYANLRELADEKDFDHSLTSKPGTEIASKSKTVYVLTDKAGNILKFDKEGNISETGKIPLYSMYTNNFVSRAFYNYNNNKVAENEKVIHDRFRAIEEALGKEGLDEYVKAYLTKIKIIQANSRNTNGVQLELDNFGFTAGYLENNGPVTPLSEIANIVGASFITEETSNTKYIYATHPTLHEAKALVVPSTIDSDKTVVETITRILLDDSIMYNGVKLSPKEKKELLSNYIAVNDRSVVQINAKGVVRINNVIVTTQQQVLDYFNNINVGEKTDTPKNAKKIITDLSQAKDTSYTFKDASGQLYKLSKPRFTFKPKTFNDVTIENNNVTVTPISNATHYTKRGTTSVKLTSDKNFHLFHPKFSVKGVSEGLNKEIDVKEANDAVTEAMENQALDWFSKSPLSKVISLENADKVSNDRPSDRIAVARFFANAITLFKGSDATDIYHEAWHAFTQGILNKEEKSKLYNEVRKIEGLESYSDLQAEEYLAEEFRKYAISQGKHTVKNSKIKSFFENVFNFLKNLFADEDVRGLKNSTELIQKHFTKLFNNEINAEDYSEKNFMFPSLNKNLELHNEKGEVVKKLSAQQTNLLLQTVDRLVTDYADLDTNVSLENGFRSVQSMLRSYGSAKAKLQELLNERTELLKKANREEKLLYSEQVEALMFALENFGDLEDMGNNLGSTNNSMISFHLNNGKTFDIDYVKNILDEEELTDEDNTSGVAFERTGNEKSLFDLVDEQVKYLLSTIGKYENKRVEKTYTPAEKLRIPKDKQVPYVYVETPVENTLGIHLLENPVVVMAKLGKLLNSSSNGDAMYKKMLEASKTDKVIAEVLLKLGDYNSTNLTNVKLWSKFIQSFNLVKIEVKPLLFDATYEDDKLRLESKHGSGVTSVKNVEQAWEAAYTSSESEYLEYSPKGRILNIQKALDELFVRENNTWKVKDKNNYVGFFRALGIDVTDNQKIEKELSKQDLLVNLLGIRLNNQLTANVYRTGKGYDVEDITSLNQLMGSMMMYSEEEDKLVKIPGLTGYYSKVQKAEFDYSDKYNSFMSINAENKSTSELSLNNSLSAVVSTVNELLTNGEPGTFLEKIKDYPHLSFLDPEVNPMIEGNNWFKALVSGKTISVENFAGTIMKDDDHVRGKVNMALDFNSKVATDIYLSYFNKSEIVRAADKTTSIHVGVSDTQPFTVDLVYDFDVDTDRTMADALKGHIVSELVRINKLKTLDENFDKNYIARGGKFIIMDDLLDVQTKEDLYAFKGTTFAELTKELASNPELYKRIVKDVNNYFNVKTNNMLESNYKDLIVTDNIREEFVDILSKSVDGFKAYNLTDDRIKEMLVAMFVRNKFMHNVDFSTMFLGDPAIYNIDKGDFHKRLAGLISTGQIFRTDNAFNNFINQKTEDGLIKAKGWGNKIGIKNKQELAKDTLDTAVITDHEIGSVYEAEYAKLISDSGAYGEGKMNEADGQGFITFDSYRALSIAQGIWTEQQEDQYNLIINRATVDSETSEVTPGSYDQSYFNEFFPSMKLQYFGPMANETSLKMQAFHKFNLIPLTPSMVKGTKLEQLHNKMMKEGIDYMTFASGSKLSVASNKDSKSSADTFYDKDRNVTDNAPFTKNVVYKNFLKNQLKIHHSYKGKITLATQMRKIAVLGIMSKDTPDVPADFKGKKEKWLAYMADGKKLWKSLSPTEKKEVSVKYEWLERYTKTLSDITEFKKAELFNDLGIKSAENLVENSSKLASLIRNELSSREINKAQIEFLFDGDSLKSDLSTNLTGAQVEKMLVALIDKRITKLKVTGEGLIQMASTMSENKDSQWKKATIEEQNQYGTNGLRFYTEKDGKIQAAQVKISLQGGFEKLLYTKDMSGKQITVYTTLSNGKKRLDYDATLAKLNELIKDEKWLEKHRDIIRMQAPRIPSQAMNSLEFLEIAEFLPKNAGNVMIVPSEIVAKSGADFDVDKLFTQFANFDMFDGYPEMIEYVDINLDKNVLSNQKSELTEKLKKLDDELKGLNKAYKDNNQLQELNRELYDLYKKEQKLSKRTGALAKQALAELDQEITFRLNMKDAIESSLADKTNAELKEIGGENYKKFQEARTRKAEIQRELNDIKRKVNGTTIKGLENNFLRTLIERLSWVDNLPELIKPNSIELVEGMAIQLEDVATSFNKHAVVHGETRTKKVKNKIAKTMSSSMVFDPLFNINKQLENSVGMDTLGIGAVTGSYYALFTSIGMYLNESNALSDAEFEALTEKSKRQNLTVADKKLLTNHTSYKIKLAHNSKEVNGRKVIDLSNPLNVSGENIADILGQLINGWVDVAKEAWIFNIQGNKQVTPTLLYLVMAGVDFKQAVILSSSKYVKEYVNNKLQMNGILYNVNTKRNSEVRSNLLEEYKDVDAFNKVSANFKEPYTLNNIEGVFGKVDEYESELDMNVLEDLVMNPGRVRTDDEDAMEVQAFEQFVAYEKVAQSITNLSMATKFDTKTFNSLSEIRDVKQKFDTLTVSNPALPTEIKTMIQDNSIIGMFNTYQLQLDLWSNFFKITTHPTLLAKAKTDYKGMRIENRPNSKHEKEFAEEFMSFLYQNEFTRINNNTYNGFKLVESTDVETVKVDGKTFYYNDAYINTLEDSGDFGNKNSVLKYLLEEEVSKNKTDFSSPTVLKSVTYALATNQAKGELEEGEDLKEKTEELYHVMNALYKSENAKELMYGESSYAMRLQELKKKYPVLAKRFSLVNDLVDSYDARTTKHSLFLPNIEQEGYKEIYEENLMALKEHPQKEVRDFFKMFDRYAVLQSGMRGFGKFVLTSIIEPNHLDNYVGPIVSDVVEALNAIEETRRTSFDHMDDFSRIFHGNNNKDEFEAFLRSKYKGVLYENSNYFRETFRLQDEAVLTLDSSAFPIDKQIALFSSKVIIKPTTSRFNPYYAKFSKTTGYAGYIGENHSDALSTEYSEDDAVWITGEAVNQKAYIKPENKVPYTSDLRKEFEQFYVPLIKKAIAANVSSINVGNNSGIEAMTREYLDGIETPYTAHKYVTRDGMFYEYNKESVITHNDGLYTTAEKETNILGNSVLELKDSGVLFAAGSKNYTDVFHYFAAYKAKYAENLDEVKQLVAELGSNATTENWMTLINKIKVDQGKNGYDQVEELEKVITKIYNESPAFAEQLQKTKDSLITYNNRYDALSKDLGYAMMLVRKAKLGNMSQALTNESDDNLLELPTC